MDSLEIILTQALADINKPDKETEGSEIDTLEVKKTHFPEMKVCK